MVLDWKRSGRVGSRRDPTKQKTMQRMVFCFVCVSCVILLSRTERRIARKSRLLWQSNLKALDWKHDGAARCQRQRKRCGGTASKGAVGEGFSPDAPRPLRCRRESHAGAKQKKILRIVFRRERADIHGSPEYRCLSPKATFECALRALRLRLPGSNKKQAPCCAWGLLFATFWQIRTFPCLNPVCAQRLTRNGRRWRRCKTEKDPADRFQARTG